MLSWVIPDFRIAEALWLLSLPLRNPALPANLAKTPAQ